MQNLGKRNFFSIFLKTRFAYTYIVRKQETWICKIWYGTHVDALGGANWKKTFDFYFKIYMLLINYSIFIYIDTYISIPYKCIYLKIANINQIVGGKKNWQGQIGVNYGTKLRTCAWWFHIWWRRIAWKQSPKHPDGLFKFVSRRENLHKTFIAKISLERTIYIKK